MTSLRHTRLSLIILLLQHDTVCSVKYEKDETLTDRARWNPCSPEISDPSQDAGTPWFSGCGWMRRDRTERRSESNNTRGETTWATHCYSFARSGHAFYRNTLRERMSFPAQCRMWNGPEAKTGLTLEHTVCRAQHKTHQQHWNCIDLNYMGVSHNYN